MEKKKYASGLRVLLVALAILIVCSVVAQVVDTSGGRVTVKSGKLLSPEGSLISYKIYIPDSATPATPAPCIIYGVGGACSLDNGSMYAIEASRRGYVAITYDAPGNGLSERNPKNDATLNAEYMYQMAVGLEFVDNTKMMNGGHSMGGQYSMRVSQNHQENVVLQFSVGMNFWGDAAKGHDFNFAYIVGSGDESALVRTTNYGTLDEMIQNPGLKALVGVPEDEKLVVDKVYGDFAAGTGRIVNTPFTIHIWEIWSPGACKDYLWAVTQSAPAPNPIDIGNMVYWIKDIALVAMVAGIGAFALGLAMMLLDTRLFAGLLLPANRYIGFENKKPLWWAGALVLLVISGVLFVWSYGNQGKLKIVSGYGNSSGKAMWSIVTGAMLTVYILVYHFVWGRKKGANARDYGLCTTPEKGFSPLYLLRAAVLAIIIFFSTYLYFRVFTFFTQSNVHWATVEINVMEWNKVNARFFPLMLLMIPFVFANCVAQKIVLNATDDSAKGTAKALFLSNVIGSTMMVVLYFALVIAALFFNRAIYVQNRAYIGGESALGGAVGFWIANTVAFYLNKKTGSIWAGTFTALLLITWLCITASGVAY